MASDPDESAMAQAIARKVASMRLAAHDETCRHEGAFQGYGAAMARVSEAMAGDALPKECVPGMDACLALLSNLQQTSQMKMAQYSGREMQSMDVIAICEALHDAPSSAATPARHPGVSLRTKRKKGAADASDT